MINSHCLPALTALSAAREAEQGARRLPDNERAHGTYMEELIWESSLVESSVGGELAFGRPRGL